jgi:hypothetical protein
MNRHLKTIHLVEQQNLPFQRPVADMSKQRDSNRKVCTTHYTTNPINI